MVERSGAGPEATAPLNRIVAKLGLEGTGERAGAAKAALLGYHFEGERAVPQQRHDLLNPDAGHRLPRTGLQHLVKEPPEMCGRGPCRQGHLVQAGGAPKMQPKAVERACDNRVRGRICRPFPRGSGAARNEEAEFEEKMLLAEHGKKSGLSQMFLRLAGKPPEPRATCRREIHRQSAPV